MLGRRLLGLYLIAVATVWLVLGLASATSAGTLILLKGRKINAGTLPPSIALPNGDVLFVPTMLVKLRQITFADNDVVAYDTATGIAFRYGADTSFPLRQFGEIFSSGWFVQDLVSQEFVSYGDDLQPLPTLIKHGTVAFFDAALTSAPLGVFSQNDWDTDGVDNRIDNCPTAANPFRDVDIDGKPIQTDKDGDGEGDACDPCNAVSNPLALTDVSIGNLYGPGKQTLEFGGTIVLSDGDDGSPAVDPVVMGARVRLQSYVLDDHFKVQVGQHIVDARIPGGSYNRVRRFGWRKRTDATGTTFTYRDKTTAPIAGITKLSVTSLTAEPSQLHFSLKGRANYLTPPVNAIAGVFAVSSPPPDQTTQCVQDSMPICVVLSNERGPTLACVS